MRTELVVSMSIAFAVGGTRTLAAQQPLERVIRFTSTPQGAEVCSVLGREWNCIGRTPLRTTVQFRSEASTKRFHLRRIGYQVGKVLVSAADSTADVDLTRLAIIPKSDAATPLALRRRQDALNDALERFLFGLSPPQAIPGFQFIGPLSLSSQEDKRILTIPIMVDEAIRATRLAPIFRRTSGRERQLEVAQVLMKDVVAPLLTALKTTIPAEAGVDLLVVAANYSRTSFSVVEDSSTYAKTMNTWAGSRTETRGGTAYRIDEFRTFTVNIPTGSVGLAAQQKIYVVVYAVPLAVVPSQSGMNNALELLDNSVVLSNDNSLGRLEILMAGHQ